MKMCFKRSLLLFVALAANLTGAVTNADRDTLRDIYAEGSISDATVDASGRQRGGINPGTSAIGRSGISGSSTPGNRVVTTTSSTGTGGRSGIISIMGTIGQAFFDTSPHAGFSNHNVSKYILLNMFSGITHALGGSQTGTSGLMALLFRVFNLGVLSMAALLLFYTSVFSVSTTSHDGGAMGSGRFSPFGFARVVGSIISLVPNFSGYSLVQVIVMKVIVAGIVVADLAWEATIDFIRFNGSEIFLDSATVVTPTPTSYGDKLIYDSDIISNIPSLSIPTPVPNTIDYVLSGSDQDEAIEKYLNHINVAIMDSVYILRKCMPVMDGVMGSDVVPMFDVRKISTMTGGVLTRDTIEVRLVMNNPRRPGHPMIVRCFDLQLNYPTAGRTAVLESNTLVFVDALKAYIEQVGGRVLLRHRQTGSSLYSDPRIKNDFAVSTQTFYNLIRTRPSSSPAPTVSGAGALQGFKKQGWASAGFHYLKLFDARRGSTSGGSTTPTRRFKEIRADNTSKLVNYAYSFNLFPLKPLTLNTSKYQGATPGNMLRELIKTEYLTLFAPVTAAPITNSGVIDWAYGKTQSVRNLLGTNTFYHGTDRFDMGPIRIRANVVPDQINAMSRGVAIAVLDAMTVDGSRGSANQFHADKENPILLTQRLGTVILGFAKDYFKNSTRQMYDEVTTAQQSAYGLMIGLSTVKGTVKAVVAQNRYYMKQQAGLSTEQKDALSKVNTGMSALGSATGIITDPIVQLIEFAASIAKAITGVYLPIGNGMAVVYFVSGLVLGAYVPFLPTLIFLFSLLAWIFSVIEAMIAAPIVMTGFAHPEGHEIIGKTDQAIMLLVGVFVRPFVTLIGFVMGMMVSVTILKLFNQMILLSAVFYFRNLNQPGIFHAVPVMVAVSGLVVLYAYALMVLLQQSYSMIYLIPDQILKWVGGPAQAAGAGIASAMRSVSSGLTQQSQAAAQGGSSASRGSTSVSTVT